MCFDANFWNPEAYVQARAYTGNGTLMKTYPYTDIL